MKASYERRLSKLSQNVQELDAAKREISSKHQRIIAEKDRLIEECRLEFDSACANSSEAFEVCAYC